MGLCSTHPVPCSTDNCARTVRAKEKAAQIAAAVAEGRSLLLHLDNASLFEEQLWQLFGPVAVRPIDAALQQPGAAVQVRRWLVLLCAACGALSVGRCATAACQNAMPCGKCCSPVASAAPVGGCAACTYACAYTLVWVPFILHFVEVM
jgi:hypothetical protein